MALVTIRIGSAIDIHQYDDGVFDSAIETTAPLKAGAPVDPNDVVILGGGGAGSITPLSVANIDNPSAELNALAGAPGSLVLAFEVEAASNQFTLYAFDVSDTGGEDVPFSVDALTSGLWIAIGGKYYKGISNFGNSTNYTSFAADGSVHFVGTAGLPHGGMFMHEAANTINLVLNTWVKVTGYTSVGLLNNVTFVSDYALTVDKIGHYDIGWSFNGDTIGGNKDIKFTIFLNDVEVPQGTGRMHTRAAGEEIAISSSAFVDITNTAHQVDMRIMNLTDSTDIILHGATFHLTQIGGT